MARILKESEFYLHTPRKDKREGQGRGEERSGWEVKEVRGRKLGEGRGEKVWTKGKEGKGLPSVSSVPTLPLHHCRQQMDGWMYRQPKNTMPLAAYCWWWKHNKTTMYTTCSSTGASMCSAKHQSSRLRFIGMLTTSNGVSICSSRCNPDVDRLHSSTSVSWPAAASSATVVADSPTDCASSNRTE